ncbi:MAG: metallophosphoesterase, partial [Oscillospiraceae bacterium]|nr:metallophosphoesterase [Oscillospiraceae bacterium]
LTIAMLAGLLAVAFPVITAFGDDVFNIPLDEQADYVIAYGDEVNAVNYAPDGMINQQLAADPVDLGNTRQVSLFEKGKITGSERYFDRRFYPYEAGKIDLSAYGGRVIAIDILPANAASMAVLTKNINRNTSRIGFHLQKDATGGANISFSNFGSNGPWPAASMNQWLTLYAQLPHGLTAYDYIGVCIAPDGNDYNPNTDYRFYYRYLRIVDAYTEIETDDFQYLSLTPGINAAQMNFAWFTITGKFDKARVQLAKAADLPAADVMPAGAQLFSGVQAAVTGHGFNSNKVTATGLAADTVYAYRVGDGETWSDIYTFKTGNPTGAYSVIGMADPQIGTDNMITGPTNGWKDCLTKAVARAGNPSFMMVAGDFTEYGDSQAEWAGYFAPPELRSLPVMPTVGNHDDNWGSGEKLLKHFFNQPNTGKNLNATGGGCGYYFSYGNTLYMSINSNSSNAAQLDQLLKDATDSHPGAVWKIALFHHDIYGSGDHANPTGGAHDSYDIRDRFYPALDKYGIDLAVNGHDHIYARSHFMKDDKAQYKQMPSMLGNDFARANPGGAYISSSGTLYTALSSGSGGKLYDVTLPKLSWVAFQAGASTVRAAQYSIMTVDGGTLTFNTYRADTNALVDSYTLRKKANFADLQSLIGSAEALPKGDILEPGWSAFQSTVTAAKAVVQTAGAETVHQAYTGIYQAYYDLQLLTDKDMLSIIIDTAIQTLADTSEGNGKGQYPFGSKIPVQAALNDAQPVYENNLAAQTAIDTAAAKLSAALDTYLAKEILVSPWVDIHEITAGEKYTVDLIDWMAGGINVAYYTTGDTAGDAKGGPRTDPPDGPANGSGGRGRNKAQLCFVHPTEWVRYELYVAQSGSYKAELGAATGGSDSKTVRLRDTQGNVLCTFIIPGNTGWAPQSVPMIPADKEFNLPEGSYVIELYFAGEGQNLDILTLERTGDIMAPPKLPLGHVSGGETLTV